MIKDLTIAAPRTGLKIIRSSMHIVEVMDAVTPTINKLYPIPDKFKQIPFDRRSFRRLNISIVNYQFFSQFGIVMN